MKASAMRLWAVLVAAAPVCAAAGNMDGFEAVLARRAEAAERAGAPKAAAKVRPLPDFGAEPCTVSLWIRTKSDGALFARVPDERAWMPGGKSLFVQGGRLNFDVGYVGCVTGRRRVSDGAWHHVAWVGAAPQRLYVDGKLDAQGDLEARPDPAACLLRFGYATDDFPEEPHFTGQLDDVRVYARALPAAEVAALAGGTPPDEGLVRHWPFDGALADLAAGGETLGAEGSPGFTEGRLGQALSLAADAFAATAPGQGKMKGADFWSTFAKGTTAPAALRALAWECEDGIWGRDWATVPAAEVGARYQAAVARYGGAATAAEPVRADGDLRPLRERYLATREAALRRMLAGGRVAFDKLLFVKRLTYNANHYYTEYINSQWMPGGNLCVLNLADGAVRELAPSLQGGVFGRFDLSFDATRVVFDWKRGADEGCRIYEVRMDGTGLRQLTFPAADEAALVQRYRRGYHHGTDDMHPCYLPDGGIAFVSTRCQYGILCDAPDIFTTTVLYRMDADGHNLRRLSNSSVSEAAPVTLPDGRILYTRWEYVDKGAVSVKCLWAMRPDGSGSSEIYGNDLSLPPTLIYGRPVPWLAGQYVVTGTPHCPQNGVGTLIRLDTRRDLRSRAPMIYLTPEVDIQDEGGFAFRVADGDWREDGEGRGALYRDPYPLTETLCLAAHKPAGAGVWCAPDGYALYAVDGGGTRTLVHREPGISCWEPFPVHVRPVPPVLTVQRNEELAARGLAACVVTDVYRGLEGVPRGTIKAIRVLEQVPRPWTARRTWDGDEYDQQHACVTKDTHLGLKVQHGVVPVADDGSAYFVVPAARNIILQVLDANGFAVQTERTFVNFMPGEVRGCVGCHERAADAGGVPAAAVVPLALRGAPAAPGPQTGETCGARTLEYARDVQPVWDRHCVRCHGGSKPAGGLRLTGDLTSQFSVSYEALVPERRRDPFRDRELLGPVIGENHPKTGNVDYLPARSLGSHASVLMALLSRGAVRLADAGAAARAKKLAGVHEKVTLTAADLQKVANWVDTNAQYYGSYWGKRHSRGKDGPDFRPWVTFDEAVSTNPPAPTAAGPRLLGQR